MFSPLRFLKRRFFFRRRARSPATLADVLKASHHAQDPLDGLYGELTSALLGIDARLDRIEARLDAVFRILDAIAKIDPGQRQIFERALHALAETLELDIRDIDTDLLDGHLPRHLEPDAAQRANRLGLLLEAVAQALDNLRH
jgi:hypothetical protein